MKYQNIIWEGRFQPIHKGHLGYIKKLLTLANRIWIIVLANECSSAALTLPVPEFSMHIDRHHASEKNPFPLWLRYLMVKEAINAELEGDANRIEIVWGHRWDLDYLFYAHALPDNRCFAIPLRDSDDDLKEKTLLELKENCIRVNVSDLPIISATMVRKAASNHEPLQEYLSPTTINLLKAYQKSFLEG